jgi:23S rRNA (cytidine1920-2'-O)/16S rRNA (cytidine1409-2'-O)-methyltransferase
MERVNARYLDTLPEPIQFASADVSFISLDLILPSMRKWLTSTAQMVVLVKPQFEAGRSDVGKGGVVKDPEVHSRVLKETVGAARSLGFGILGLMPSPLRGPAGNVEFLLWLTTEEPDDNLDTDALVSSALAEVRKSEA